MKYEQFLEHLKGVKQTGPKQSIAHCPAHADSHQSLSVGNGDTGGILLCCHAGCELDDILDAIGLSKRDIAAPDIYFPIAEYSYFDRDGNLLATKVRKQNGHGGKKFAWKQPSGIWKKPDVPLLYNAQLLSMRNDIIIVEGEKDAARLTAHGLLAVSPPNGAGKKWDNAFDCDLAGKDIFIIPDNDPIGIRTAHDIAAHLQPIVHVVKVLDLKQIWYEIGMHGDYSDMENALGNEEAIKRLVSLSHSAPEWSPAIAAAALGSAIPIVPPLLNATAPTQQSAPPSVSTAVSPPDNELDIADISDNYVTGEFPVDSFPPWLRDYVVALTAYAETPLELASLLVLGVLATACQDKYTLFGGWKEQLSLYTVAAANSGERKSIVIEHIIAPIVAYERQVQIDEKAEIARNRNDFELLESILKNAMARAKSGDAAAKEEAYRLREEYDNFEKRYPKCLLIDDVTPEKLVNVLEEQNSCITVASAEGGLFSDMLGRYSTGPANHTVYLAGHSGDRIRVDRKTSGTVVIESPKMSTIIATQPSVLRKFIGNETLRNKGACARFLCVVCKPRAGNRPNLNPPIPPQIEMQYTEILTQKLSDIYRGELHLSQDAIDIRRQYSNAIEPKFRSEWAHMADFGGKFVGAMLRIAGLLHVASIYGDPTTTEVSAETVQSAIKIADYLALHAEKVYAMAGTDPRINDAKFLLGRIQDMTNTSSQAFISKRALFNALRSRYGDIRTMTASLRILQSMDYIRIDKVQTGGRPSEHITLNPDRLTT